MLFAVDGRNWGQGSFADDASPPALGCHRSSSASSGNFSAAACSQTASPLQSEYSRREASITVRLTRRHHPLAGQVLDVVMSGRTQIVVRLGDGTAMRVPRAWTDAEGTSVPTGESVFTVEALRALLARVALLRREV